MFQGSSVLGRVAAVGHKGEGGVPQRPGRDESWCEVVEGVGEAFQPTHLVPPLSSSLSLPGCPWPVARWCVAHQAAVAAPHSSCQGRAALQKYFSAATFPRRQVECWVSQGEGQLVERELAASS